MMIDPKLLQWIAAVLLILSGVQNFVAVARYRGATGLRGIGSLIALAATAFGVYMVVILLGAKV